MRRKAITIWPARSDWSRRKRVSPSFSTVTPSDFGHPCGQPSASNFSKLPFVKSDCGVSSGHAVEVSDARANRTTMRMRAIIKDCEPRLAESSETTAQW
jgi:hypothetical protein